jgi:regulator of protease activity HflC (stomatin/prohibitin superfamily)
MTGTVLLFFAFSSLEATEFGLDYSWISKTINPTASVNGLHFLGIGHSFIRYPKTVQTIEFSHSKGANRPPIQSRTSDGLEVVLEISFQYILQPEHLFQLYMRYGDDYKKVFENIAIDNLTDEATKYTAYSFFWDRGNIKDDFKNSLDLAFQELCYSNIQFLQLRSVDLPNAFEDAIQLSEVKKQDIQKAKAELNKVNVELDTMIKSADYQKNVTINNADAEAQAIGQQNDAEVKSIKQMLTSQGTAYTKLKTDLKLTNPELMDYIKAEVIRGHSSQNLAVNLDNISNNKNLK